MCNYLQSLKFFIFKIWIRICIQMRIGMYRMICKTHTDQKYYRYSNLTTFAVDPDTLWYGSYSNPDPVFFCRIQKSKFNCQHQEWNLMKIKYQFNKNHAKKVAWSVPELKRIRIWGSGSVDPHPCFIGLDPQHWLIGFGLKNLHLIWLGGWVGYLPWPTGYVKFIF